MKPKRVIRREYEKSVKAIAGKYERVAGWIGLDASTIETGIPDLIYVRMVNGQAVKAVNKLAPLVYNYPVVIARNDSSAHWEVVEVRQPYSVPLSQIASHHGQHEYPSKDTVWVRDAQFLPLLVLPTSGMTVAIYGGVVRAGGQYYIVENQVLDLTASVPASGAKWALIEVIAGVITVTLSAEYDGYSELLPTNIPIGSGYALCAIRLYTGQTQISRDGSTNDFVDLRFTKADAVLTLGELGDVDISTPADGEVLTYDSYTGLWTNAAIPAGVGVLDDLTDVNVPAPADGEVLTYDSYTGLWVANAPAGGGAWGSITGTLSDQIDLNTALNAKLVAASNLSDLANAGTARTNLGLVSGGAGDIWVEKAGDTMTGQLFIDGGSDQIQLRVQGHSTQTSVLQTWENSAGTVQLLVDNTGHIAMGSATPLTSTLLHVGGYSGSLSGATGQYLINANAYFGADATSLIALSFTAITRSSGTPVTIPSFVGVYSQGCSPGANVTISTQYGFRCGDVTQGSTNYAVYTGKGFNRLGDRLGVENWQNIENLYLKQVASQTANFITFYNSSFGVFAKITAKGGAVFNENGESDASADFRVESDSYDAIFVDASDNSIKLFNNASGKIGLFNATPIVQPTTAIAEASFTENAGGAVVNVDSTFDGYTIQQFVKALRDLGVLA